MINKLFIFLILLVAITACNDKNQGFIKIDPYDLQVINYFEKVALGFSNSDINKITRKWKDPMIVYMNPKASNQLNLELEKIVGEINALSTDGFEVEITNDSLLSNFDIFIGSAKEYYKVYPSQGDTTSTSRGSYNIYWRNKSDIFYGNMLIDQNQEDATYHRFILRKFLTASIGLTNQWHDYPESIFYQGWSIVNNYQRIDRDLIRLLYHPDMNTGWSGEVLRNKLLNILMNEKG
ncbi:MAG: DUF2927 domain-containing protein [Cyclobacteriaceae bacterium]|nr:DUF2927 domain-containing protein [Cyclobacteriaceae bacterium]